MRRSTTRKTLYVLFLTICLCAMTGCSGKEAPDTEPLTVYSFSGENEVFSVSNGIVVLTPDEDVFYGGKLTLLDEESFSDTASYSTTFYTLENGARNTILSNSVTDMTENSVKIEGALGGMSGPNLLGTKVDQAEALHGLCFELSIIDENGSQNKYDIQLDVIDITSYTSN